MGQEDRRRGEEITPLLKTPPPIKPGSLGVRTFTRSSPGAAIVPSATKI